jgi:hypothetical protein
MATRVNKVDAPYMRQNGKPIPDQLTFDDTAYYIKRNGSIFLILVAAFIYGLVKLVQYFK